MFRRFRSSRDKPGRESCFRFPLLSSFESLPSFSNFHPSTFSTLLSLFHLPPLFHFNLSLSFHSVYLSPSIILSSSPTSLFLSLSSSPLSSLSTSLFFPSLILYFLLSPFPCSTRIYFPLIPYFSFISPISYLLPFSHFLFPSTFLYLNTSLPSYIFHPSPSFSTYTTLSFLLPLSPFLSHSSFLNF